jgi:hypothetical protein
MGKMSLDIDDTIEHEFRMKTFKVFGHKKGALSKAAESAFSDWDVQKWLANEMRRVRAEK